MKPNVGGFDRTARIAVGVVLLIVGLTAPVSMTWKVIVLVVAGVALVTAAVRFCPANALLGINTCKLEQKK